MNTVPRQFVIAATAETGLLLAVFLFFILKPQTTLTVALAAIAAAVGIVAGVVAIYRAVGMMSEPATRSIAWISILLIITGPIVLLAVTPFI